MGNKFFRLLLRISSRHYYHYYYSYILDRFLPMPIHHSIFQSNRIMDLLDPHVVVAFAAGTDGATSPSFSPHKNYRYGNKNLCWW
jgi:hypothetical protein